MGTPNSDHELITHEVMGDANGNGSGGAPDIILEQSGSIRGVVARASGQPVRDAAILLVEGPGSAPDIAPLTDKDGWFVIDGLPAGTWILKVLGPQAETGQATVEVAAASVAGIRIVVNAP